MLDNTTKPTFTSHRSEDVTYLGAYHQLDHRLLEIENFEEER